MQQVTGKKANENGDGAAENLSVWQVVCSVFAAGLGVQSKENKVRDFSRGKPQQFIIAGLVFTAVFLIALITVVNLVV